MCVPPLDESSAGRGSHPDLGTFELEELGMDLRAQGFCRAGGCREWPKLGGIVQLQEEQSSSLS